VFSRDSRINVLLSIVFLTLSACGGLGSGCGCSNQPLPPGGLPDDQTVEGGGQVRVTRAGFEKLTSIIPAVLNDSLGEGFCVGQGQVGTPSGGFLATGARYCATNQGPTPNIPDACGAGNGCNVGVHVDRVVPRVVGQALNIEIQLDAFASVPLSGQVIGIGFSCTLGVDGPDIVINADIGFEINPTTGALGIRLIGINGLDTSDLDFSGCSVVSDVANLVNSLLNSFIGEFIVDLLEPTLNDLIQGFLPDPLGIEGMVNIGEMLAGVSPGTEGFMEARMIPGGYVQLVQEGMSLGLITGLNADFDPGTRTPELDSEPAYCVPPIPAPNFAAPPASLPVSSRGTFTLAAAGAFVGNPEPSDDLAIGLSETTLDLAGHHLVTSGGLCLGVGTSLIEQLKLGTIGLLVPSVGELGTGDEPLLLVTRPQKAIDFSIGDGTEQSPALTLHIKDFEVDFYGFIFERYTRAFSMSLDLDVGVNLEFVQMPGMPAQVKPILVGLSSSNIGITVLNNEFVRETRDELEAVLPTVFDLALPLLGNGIGPIDVPDFAGFTLNNLRVQKVTTAQDDFMAIYASLGTSQMLRDLAATKYPSMNPVLDTLDRGVQLEAWPNLVQSAQARLRSIEVPAPDVVRAALAAKDSTGLPHVTIDVDTHDAQGRELEWSWNINGGLFRPYAAGSPIVIADRAFSWQGKYAIGLTSRVKGDYRTATFDFIEVPVVIDSAAPKIRVDEARWDGEQFLVPATDAVYERSELQWAWGRPGDTEPATDWSDSARLDKQTVKDLSADQQILVFVRDPSNNVGSALARTGFHGAPGESGCNCSTPGASPGLGSIVLMLLVGAFLLFRQRAASIARIGARASSSRAAVNLVIGLGIATGMSLVPGCSCGNSAGQACEITEDCLDFECPPGQIPVCFEGECVCAEDVPYGRIGVFSDVAVAPNGDAIVSAYAQLHGDLVVARHLGSGRIDDKTWEFVDGVPEGPVVLPDSDVRGGIMEPGDDVGMYTAVAIGAADVPMVSYHARETGSLKFAAKYGGTWQTHVIDDGTGQIDPEIGGETSGLYTAMTLRSDDGAPGVAYMTAVSQGGGIVTAEVRFAQASSAQPQSSADWTVSVLDSMTLPAPDPENPDIYPLPDGIGLFVETARDPNNNPVVVYYDRENGDLKIVRGNGAGFDAPAVIAGQTTDDGWYPSVSIDTDGVAHVAFQGADHDDVFYINTMSGAREMVDDGYRIVGTTEDGLPKPEFHFVGSDTQIVWTAATPFVIYQDSTSHELLAATKEGPMWRPEALAGAEMDFVGAYGFSAAAALGNNEVVISTWAMHQSLRQNWVEIFRLPIAAQ
jgi:MYXO-CTERM domain-containing protein